jgi:hypothetical protein
MNIAQVLVIILYAADLLCAAYMHGKWRTGKHSFWGALIANSIEIGLLLWGGFWG